jgi:hypothetical protein
LGNRKAIAKERKWKKKKKKKKAYAAKLSKIHENFHSFLTSTPNQANKLNSALHNSLDLIVSTLPFSGKDSKGF